MPPQTGCMRPTNPPESLWHHRSAWLQ
jgi:hypothetical protein